MKKYFIMLLVTLSFVSCGEAQEKTIAKKPKAKKEQTTPIVNKVVAQSEFKTLMSKKDAQLIDVRTPEEYNDGYIENAKNINFNSADFKAKMEKLDKTKPVLIYCHSGGRSGKTAAMLKEMGFKEVYDLQSGYSGWKK